MSGWRRGGGGIGLGVRTRTEANAIMAAQENLLDGADGLQWVKFASFCCIVFCG